MGIPPQHRFDKLFDPMPLKNYSVFDCKLNWKGQACMKGKESLNMRYAGLMGRFRVSGLSDSAANNEVGLQSFQ